MLPSKRNRASLTGGFANTSDFKALRLRAEVSVVLLSHPVGLTGCKWSNLDAPGTETPLSHPYLDLGELLFLIISPLGPG